MTYPAQLYAISQMYIHKYVRYRFLLCISLVLPSFVGLQKVESLNLSHERENKSKTLCVCFKTLKKIIVSTAIDLQGMNEQVNVTKALNSGGCTCITPKCVKQILLHVLLCIVTLIFP